MVAGKSRAVPRGRRGVRGPLSLRDQTWQFGWDLCSPLRVPSAMERVSEMAKKEEQIRDIPTPPIPATLLPKDDPQYEPTVTMKPEDIRAKLLVEATRAIDALQWHVCNLSDPKSSIAASAELLNRAGFVAPKGQAVDAIQTVEGGESLPPIEDEVKAFNG